MPAPNPPQPALPLRLAYALAVLPASWYAMMAVHEFGHVLGASATGGTVRHVSLPLLGFSRTDIAPNPHPLAVAWAGPVVGVLLPLLMWAIAHAVLRYRYRLLQQTLRFFAGFTFLANGAYLGAGWLDHIGDAGDLLRHGAALWQLVTFGVVCVAAGLCLWHGLGPWLGLGTARPRENQAEHAT